MKKTFWVVVLGALALVCFVGLIWWTAWCSEFARGWTAFPLWSSVSIGMLSGMWGGVFGAVEVSLRKA